MKKINPLPGIPLVESPLFSKFFNSDNTDPKLLKIATDLNVNGYAIVRDIIPDLDKICDSIISDLSSSFDIEEWRNRLQKGLRGGLRIQDAWKDFDSVKKVANSQEIIDLLSLLYGKTAFPFQTLNFPVGTEQHFHTDSIHFSSYPHKFMVGVWIALEDISMDQGPLVYYPGTHKWPVLDNVHFGASVSSGDTFSQARYEDVWREMVDSMNIKPSYFEAKKGDILIWAANLLHGGHSHTNLDKTRWSQVTHYFFDDCMYYTPMLSDFAIGAVKLRQPQDSVTGIKHESKFLGESLTDEYLAHVQNLSQKIKLLQIKRREELLPEDFDGRKYLELNTDIEEAGSDPVKHYLQNGIKEGRRYK